MEWLRGKAEACYIAGDLDCVWSCYFALAEGAPLFGYPHAAVHLEQFLLKRGNLDWGSFSLWVFNSPSVQAEMPSINEDIFGSVHAAARGSDASGYIETKQYPVQANPATEEDLYYAMYGFQIWAEADYSARQVFGCNSLVVIRTTYRFWDAYDWHEGLAAGGGVPGVSGFQDEWAAALHDHGLALEYEIEGHQTSIMILVYPPNWLDADRPAPLFYWPLSFVE